MDNAKLDLSAVPGSIPFVHNLDAAPAYWWLDILWVILARGEDTGGRYSLMYEWLPKGSGAPPHKHSWSDEHFYITKGEVTFLVGEEIRKGRVGDFVIKLTANGLEWDIPAGPMTIHYTAVIKDGA